MSTESSVSFVRRSCSSSTTDWGILPNIPSQPSKYNIINIILYTIIYYNIIFGILFNFVQFCKQWWNAIYTFLRAFNASNANFSAQEEMKIVQKWQLLLIHQWNWSARSASSGNATNSANDKLLLKRGIFHIPPIFFVFCIFFTCKHVFTYIWSIYKLCEIIFYINWNQYFYKSQVNFGKFNQNPEKLSRQKSIAMSRLI